MRQHNDIDYHPEIDGLRALAVVSVVIFHLKIPTPSGQILTGGFVGVDMFFVISGFLITRLICHELQTTGSFDLRRFYARRARRILPALLLVILASILAALWLMTPSEIARLLRAALAAIGFVSNIFWFFELGEYGAQSGLLQPLLHCWSLAIEEQFYLLFPLLLIWLRRSKAPAATLAVLVTLFLLSLGAAEITSTYRKDASFFSPISRAWELLAGAIMAVALVYVRPAPPPDWARHLPKLALATILLCMATLDLADWRHPGVITLPVVLATAALIYCAQPGEATTALLSTPAMVSLGKLSYAIYLWHFPVFAFGRLSTIETPGPTDKLIWLLITAVLSWLNYRLIEQPFRRTLNTRTCALSLAAACAVIGAIFVYHLQTHALGVTNTKNLTALYGGPFHDNEQLREQSWSILDSYSDRETIGPWNAHQPSQSEGNTHWYTRPDTGKILVLGNSHAKDLFNALHAMPQTRLEFARFGIAADFPDAQLRLLRKSPNFQSADVVLIAPRHNGATLNRLSTLVPALQDSGKTIAIVGNAPRFISPGQIPIYDYLTQRHAQPPAPSKINQLAYGSQESVVAAENARLKDIADQTGALYLSRIELLCSAHQKSCTLATPEGAKTMYDDEHWTLSGARYVGQKIHEQGWLDPLADKGCASCTASASTTTTSTAR